MILYCLRRTLQPSATGTGSFRSDASTSGSAISPAACMIHCVRFACFVRKRYLLLLRNRRNTRYGWVANPFPTGTFTLQDAPSFAWRANDCHHRTAEAAGYSWSGGWRGYVVTLVFRLMCPKTPIRNPSAINRRPLFRKYFSR